MQGTTAVKMMGAMSVLVLILALAVTVYRSNGAGLNWQAGEGDPIIKFYQADSGVYTISPTNISMVNWTGSVKWTIPFAGTQYSAMGNDGRLYAYSADTGLDSISPDGTATLLTVQGMNHPPMVGPDGTIYLRSWGILSAMSPSGDVKWNVSGIVSEPAIDTGGNIYFFMRPPDNISDVYLYCMTPDGTVRWSTLYNKFDGEISLMPAKIGGIFVYDQPVGILYHIDEDGSTTWDRSMTYLGQYNLLEDENDRMYLFYLWGTVYVIGENGTMLSKFNPVVTYNVNLTYEPAAHNDLVYVIGDDKYPDSDVLYALNIDGTLKWKRQFNSSASPTIYAGNSIICVATDAMEGGKLTPVLDVIDGSGTLKFAYKSGDGQPWEQVYISPDNTIYALTAGGMLYSLKG